VFEAHGRAAGMVVKEYSPHSRTSPNSWTVLVRYGDESPFHYFAVPDKAYILYTPGSKV